MKTNIIIIWIVVIIISSCTSPKYLPLYDKIDVNEYGAYIDLTYNRYNHVYGELIALDRNEIVVLKEYTKKCVVIPVKELNGFHIKFAKLKNSGSGWIIPFGLFLPLIHGYYSVFTIPAHLIGTISVAQNEENIFKISDKKMTYDQLKMFARFPQGIPPNIDIVDIK